MNEYNNKIIGQKKDEKLEPEYYEDQTYRDYKPQNKDEKKTWLKHEIVALIDERFKEMNVRTFSTKNSKL